MKNKKWGKYIVIFIILVALAVFAVNLKRNKPDSEVTKEIKPVMGAIQTAISTTGTVLPKNRLEIKPPVNGRVESILVKEGDKVKVGQTLAWMSSTERAALLDAARGQGEAALNYWQNVYKPIGLLAPIDGEVIVATIQPGQTVTTSEAIVVLSDHLIVRAEVDETDIGKVELGQPAVITLDAYPGTEIEASVEHIYYESETVNNVTVYKVDLVPKEVSPFFRSGMNASVNFIEESKKDVLLVPVEALHKEKDKNYVFVKDSDAQKPVKRAVEIGISDDKNVEIISGLDKGDKIIITTRKYVLPTSTVGGNPFMPDRKKK
ncbi:MAG: efflux RND transporter periplasmic adaptor subunit [Candidatus Omnitrophica bacterium]|nr:efflux RND transporter periplasmic adaptor subunit [Candidatus Omnitrophota bacterium]